MNVHEAETTVLPDGSVVLSGLPFAIGSHVRVLVMPTIPSGTTLPWESLRGTVLHYDDPFGPAVPPEDWDVYNDSD